MRSAIECIINEINMKNIDSFYRHDLFIYNMIITFSTGGKLNIDSLRLVNLNIISHEHIRFRFINMNKFCKRNYTKFTESYTEFNLYPAKNILNISYYVYWMNGDYRSKDIIDGLELNISNCPTINNFLYLLYNKYQQN
jgi:hypothetical protein